MYGIQSALIDGPTESVRVLPAAMTVFKTASVTASGLNALWTPATGKSFVVCAYAIEVTQNASLTSGGILDVTLYDANTPMPLAASVFVPTAAVTTGAGNCLQTPWIDISPGLQSAAANNGLSLFLSRTLATGTCRVVVAGREV